MWAVDDLRRRLGLDEEIAEDDTLEEMEAEAVAHFERATNRYFGPVDTIVETLSIGRQRMSVTLRAPVAELTTVEARWGAASVSWQQPWAVSAFELDDNRLILFDGSLFPTGPRVVRVTYTGGYATDDEPADVRGAVLAIVRATYQGQRSAVESEASPANSSAALVIPQAAQEVINNWRRNPGT